MIVNPSAGGGRAAKVLPAYEAAFADLGLPCEVRKTTSLPHAAELAATAAREGKVAAALGGDGIVGTVAGALRAGDGLLAILPGGRGNDLARVLEIPSNPVEAAALVAAGVEQRLDLGIVEERPYVGIASLGFDSDANRIANESKLVKGNLVYAYAALRALVSWRPARFELEHDEGTETIVGYSVAAANSKAYGGGMFIAPGARLDDGLLDVVVLGDVGKLRFLRGLPTVFKGTHVERPDVRTFRTRTLKVSADRPFTVYADGDPIAELPTEITVEPSAVRVIVPA